MEVENSNLINILISLPVMAITSQEAVIVSQFPEGVSTKRIRDLMIGWMFGDPRSVAKKVLDYVTLEKIEIETEYLRASGVLKRLPSGEFALSEESRKNWDYFRESYTRQNPDKNLPDPL